MIQLWSLLTALLLMIVWAGAVQAVPLCLASGVLCVGALVTMLRGERLASCNATRFIKCCMLVSVVWVGAMLLPVPEGILERVDPSQAELAGNAAAATAQAKALGWYEGGAPPTCFALNRGGCFRIFVLLCGAGCAAFLSATMSSKQKRLLLMVLVSAALVNAVAGLVSRHVAPAHKVWWLFDVGRQQSMGCFVNPNHFGAFLAMFSPVVIVMAARDIRRHEWERLVIWVLVLAVFIAAVVSSHSRGAYIVLTASLLVGGALVFRRANATVGIATCVVLCLGLLLIAVLGPPEVDKEMRELKHMKLNGRAAVWQQSVRVWRDFPVTGVGPEGFRSISSRYETGSADYYASHAESMYLQILADGGVIGVFLACVLLAGLAWSIAVRCRRETVRSAEFAAGLGAACVVLLHGCFDFPMHVPVYAVTAATLVGLLLPAPRQGRKGKTGRRSLAHRWIRAAAPAAAMLAICSIAFRYGSHIYRRDKYRHVAAADPAELLQTLQWAPSFWATWYYLGQEGLTVGTPESERFAEVCIARACELNPRNPELWQSLALLRNRLGDNTGAAEAVGRYRELMLPQR